MLPPQDCTTRTDPSDRFTSDTVTRGPDTFSGVPAASYPVCSTLSNSRRAFATYSMGDAVTLAVLTDATCGKSVCTVFTDSASGRCGSGAEVVCTASYSATANSTPSAASHPPGVIRADASTATVVFELTRPV